MADTPVTLTPEPRRWEIGVLVGPCDRAEAIQVAAMALRFAIDLCAPVVSGEET